MLRFADHGSQAASHGLSLLPAASGFHLLLFALLAQDGFARQADLVVLDGEDFDEDLAARFSASRASRRLCSAISLMCSGPAVLLLFLLHVACPE